MAPALRSPTFLVLAALIAAAVGAVLLRHQLVEFVLIRLLTGKGLQVQSLTVQHVGFDRVRLSGLRLGPDGLLAIDRLAAEYRPAELLGGRVRQLEIDGLRLTLDLTAEGDPLGPFRALSEGQVTSADSKALPPLPAVQLTDGTVELVTAQGDQRIGLGGSLSAVADGEYRVTLHATLDGALARGQAEVAADLAADWDVTGRASLQDGALALPAAQMTGIAGEMQFELPGGEIGRLHGKVSAARLRLASADKTVPPFREAVVDFDLGATQAKLMGRLESESGAFHAVVSADIADYRQDPSYAIELSATVAHDSVLWAAFDLPQPESGRHRIAFHAAGPAPPLEAWSGDAIDIRLFSLLDGSRLRWSAEDLSYPGRLAGLNATLVLDGRVEGGMLSLTLAEDAVLRVATVAPALERDLGLPAALAPVLPDASVLTLFADGARPFSLTLGLGKIAPRPLALRLAATAAGLWGGRLDLAGDLTADLDEANVLASFSLADAQVTGANLRIGSSRLGKIVAAGRIAGMPSLYDGELSLDLTELQVAAPPLQLGDVGAAIDLKLSRGPDGLAIATAKPGRATLAGLSSPGRFELQDPIELSLKAADLRLGPTTAPVVVAQVQAEIPEAAVRLYSGAAASTEVHPAQLQGLGLDLKLEGDDWQTAILSAKAQLAAIRLPEDAIAATDLRLTANGDAGLQKIDADYSLGALQHEGAPAAFTPLAIAGALSRNGKELSFTLDGAWAELPSVVTALGWHDLESGDGRLDGSFKPPAFDPGGLQPVAFVPALSVLEKVSGEAEATARFDWGADGVESLGLVALKDMGFTGEGIKVRGLHTAISFDDLLALHSLPYQLLTADRIDPGLPVTDLSLRYQLDPAAPGGLRLGKGAFTVLGARVSLAGNDSGTDAALQDVTFSVRGLQLEKLFQVIDAEGFSGSGDLAGSIPVAVKADTLVIRDARLAATAPGRLQIKSAEAKALLQAGGEQATLLLEALEDFHYDELSLTLANTAENDLDLTLSILGNNPAVLEGHPFQLNINLESNIDRLLDALLAGYRLSNQTLQRLWSLRP